MAAGRSPAEAAALPPASADTGGLERLLGETAALFSAGRDGSRWQRALTGIGVCLQATALNVVVGNAADGVVLGNGLLANEMPALLHWLSTAAAADAPWFDLPADAPDACLTGRHLVMRLPGAQGRAGYVVLFQRDPATPFAPAAAQTLALLVPQIAAALTLAQQQEAAASAQARCEQCTAGLPFGIVLLDARGKVTDVNPAAKAILAAGDGLRLDDGALRGQRVDEQTLLDDMIDSALAGRCSDGEAIAVVTRPSGRSAYLVLAVPLAQPTSAFAQRGARVRLTLIDGANDPPLPCAELRALFSLTEAEARVACALAAGATADDAATTLGISRHTLRHHLERVFQKTGVRRQSDLVRALHLPFLCCPSPRASAASGGAAAPLTQGSRIG